MAEEIRIGVVGCGHQTRDNLVPRLATLQGVHLVACADVNPAAAQTMAQRLGFERSYRDYREMFAEEKLDAAIVAIPHALLKGAAIAALKAGCHLFVEKPMGIDAQEGREIVALAGKAKKRVMVGYCQRYAEGRLRLKSLIEKGAIGEISAISAGKGSGRFQGWLMDPQMGGGELLYLGVHITDQILWMVKSEPQVVFGQVNLGDTGVDDTSAYVIRFASGVLANVTVSMSAGTGYDFLEVLGTKGRGRAEWASNIVWATSLAIPEYSTFSTLMPAQPGSAPMFGAEMQEWVASLAEDREPAINGEDGVKVLQVIDAVKESACSGAPVTLG